MPVKQLTLRELRRSLYLTVPEAAVAAGIDPATVGKYERGCVLQPQLKTIRGLANAYGVHPDVIAKAVKYTILVETQKTIRESKKIENFVARGRGMVRLQAGKRTFEVYPSSPQESD